MVEVLQNRLPFDVHAPRRLPGTHPCGPDDWTMVDEAYAGQMAVRDDLLLTRPDDVLRTDPEAVPAAGEVLELALDLFRRDPGRGFAVAEDAVLRPDGLRVALDRDAPLRTLGRLLQEDICILQKRGDEHVLTGACLCFPASWRLDEKFGRPLIGIHEPVRDYDGAMAQRVQRLFDGVQVGRPLWRFNRLWYQQADLHQPRSVHERRPGSGATDGPYLRSERQTILRLPRSGAVVFAIHTFVLARADVPPVPVA